MDTKRDIFDAVGGRKKSVISKCTFQKLDFLLIKITLRDGFLVAISSANNLHSVLPQLWYLGSIAIQSDLEKFSEVHHLKRFFFFFSCRGLIFFLADRLA